MKTSTKALAKIIERWAPGDGYFETPIAGVSCTKFSKPDQKSKRLWRARFAIVVQGCKEVELGSDLYRAREGDYTIGVVDLPVVSRIQAAPFAALLLEVDPRVMSELDSQMEPLSNDDQSDATIFKGHADDRILEAATKLAQLFEKPEEARVLGPLLVRELFYLLLKTPGGTQLRGLVRAGSHRQKITRAIHDITSELKTEIDVEMLARKANMSRSAFFKHFKDATSLSPIQYQKRLRLLEAKRRMTSEGESAEQAAFAVGYNSASQFSREYSRLFGRPPLQDAKNSSGSLR